MCGSLLTSAFLAQVIESVSLAHKGENKAQSHSSKGKSETNQETHILKVCLFYLSCKGKRQGRQDVGASGRAVIHQQKVHLCQ